MLNIFILFRQAIQRAKDPAQQPDPAGGGHAVSVWRQAAGRAAARGGCPRRLPPRARQASPPRGTLRLLPSRGTNPSLWVVSILIIVLPCWVSQHFPNIFIWFSAGNWNTIVRSRRTHATRDYLTNSAACAAISDQHVTAKFNVKKYQPIRDPNCPERRRVVKLSVPHSVSVIRLIF